MMRQAKEMRCGIGYDNGRCDETTLHNAAFNITYIWTWGLKTLL